jgi:hypothetical protein
LLVGIARLRGVISGRKILMKFTIEQFRTDKQVRRDVLDTSKYGDWNMCEIFRWGIYTYVHTGRVRLIIGVQNLHVIDVTDTILNIARFHDRYHNYPAEQNEGNYAMVYTPDEGECVGLLHMDNDDHHYYIADLPIYIGVGADAELTGSFGDMAWAISECKVIGWTQDDKTIANTIRAAARRDGIGAWQGASRRWYFPKQAFQEYAYRSMSEQRGRPSTVSTLIENSDGNASAIQHELAEMARSAIGNIPGGQLWQPCECPGCSTEPVCMNCMMCEDEHCNCFD